MICIYFTCVTCVSCPQRGDKRCQIPWNWSYGVVSQLIRVPRIKLQTPARAASVLNSWAISPLLKRNSLSPLGSSFAILLAPSHSVVRQIDGMITSQKSFVFCLLWCIVMWISIYQTVQASLRNLLRGCPHIHLLLVRGSIWPINSWDTQQVYRFWSAPTLRRKAPCPQEFVWEHWPGCTRWLLWNLQRQGNRNTRFPWVRRQRGREISAPDRGMKQ